MSALMWPMVEGSNPLSCEMCFSSMPELHGYVESLLLTAKMGVLNKSPI